MPNPIACEVDRIIFDSGLVRVGAFRCHPNHPSFHDSGPTRNCCFVFPRTAIQIQHEHERAFVANPNIVTFYNLGQTYLRNAVSAEGDRCDWFGIDTEVVHDVVRTFDPEIDSRPERPFRFTRTCSDANTYLWQRWLFEKITVEAAKEPLAIEENVVGLLEQVVASAYRTIPPRKLPAVSRKQYDLIHQVELILSQKWNDCLSLREVASEVGISVYHLCRMFRQGTGTTIHQYRQQLRVRHALESVTGSSRPLVDIALDTGFSNHSHFTSCFHREFNCSPSVLRRESRAIRKGTDKARFW